MGVILVSNETIAAFIASNAPEPRYAELTSDNSPIIKRYTLIPIPGTELCEAGAHTPFSLAFEQSERELGEMLGYPALVYDGEREAPYVQPLAELEQFRTALETIRRDYGHVCENFDRCSHTACRDSFSSWHVANDALTTVAPTLASEINDLRAALDQQG